jgi:TPR repeat protein/DNA-binding transcriptional regulator YbjK
MRANTATDSNRTDVNRTRARARDRSAARLSVLEAARKLAAKDGIENVTLAAVAVEAGFARATVYGYFKNKDELLQAVVAEDLSGLAEMVSGDPPIVEAVETRPAEEAPVAPVELVAEQTVEEPAAESPPAIADVPANARAERQAKLETILSQLAPNDLPGSEGSAASLARFDRRLRVVERTIGDVQSHQQKTDKTTTLSADTVAETLRGLSLRFEESERRQRETFAELRASAREAARRLETLEAVKIAYALPVPEPVVEAPVVKEAPVSEDAPVQDEMGADALEVETEEMEAEAVEQMLEVQPAEFAEQPAPLAEAKPNTDWLNAARQSAMAAAAPMQPEKATARPKSWLYRVPRKYLMFTCALLSVVVLFVGVLVVQRATAIAAMAEPMPRVAAKHATHLAALQRMASVTPLDELSALASSGNGKAQLIVGLKYLKGDAGVAKNPVAAAQWIGRAAQRGEPMAEYWAGYVYQHGVGVSADPDEAIRWYEAAADQGNVKAMYNLGVGNAEGWTGAKDVPEAARWFARAARLGFVDAQFNLAVLYERGDGVPASMMDAYKWYAVAAANGDLDSKQRLEAMTTQMSADDIAAAQRSALMFKPTPQVTEANQVPSLGAKRG